MPPLQFNYLLFQGLWCFYFFYCGYLFKSAQAFLNSRHKREAIMDTVLREPPGADAFGAHPAGADHFTSTPQASAAPAAPVSGGTSFFSVHRCIRLLLLISLLGALLSTYLSWSYYRAEGGGVCLAGACGTVTQSHYAAIAGIPVAMLGVAWFAVLGALTFFAHRPAAVRKKSFLYLLAGWSSSGLLFVVYLVGAEIRLRAICSWCTAVHVLVLLALAASILLLKKSAAGKNI